MSTRMQVCVRQYRALVAEGKTPEEALAALGITERAQREVRALSVQQEEALRRRNRERMERYYREREAANRAEPLADADGCKNTEQKAPWWRYRGAEDEIFKSQARALVGGWTVVKVCGFKKQWWDGTGLSTLRDFAGVRAERVVPYLAEVLGLEERTFERR